VKRIKQNFAIFSLLTLFCGVKATGEQPAVRAVVQLQPVRTAAPAFRLHNAAGTSVALASLGGQVVLLNFWATECGR
jgi:hypothetical protein